jgi:hypothetical protein
LSLFTYKDSADTIGNNSLNGTTKSIEETQERINNLLPPEDFFRFGVYRKVTDMSSDVQVNSENVREEKWEVFGLVFLSKAEPFLPLPTSSSAAQSPTVIEESQLPSVQVFTLGYMFLKDSWGFGYATEAVAGVLSEFRGIVSSAAGTTAATPMFVQAIVSPNNPASLRVMQKIGATNLGIKDWKERKFLAGAWQDGKTVTFGMYL